MTVRAKMLAITGVTLIALIAVVVGISAAILVRNCNLQEQKDVLRDLSRAADALDNEISALGNMAADYACWDDTYAFIENANQAYIKSNFIDETFTKNRISFAILAGLEGRIVFGKALDLAEEKEMPLPEGLLDHLSHGRPLVLHRDEASTVDGLIVLPDGAYLVASRPILTSRYTGPIRGTLIFGRLLDEGEVGRLSKLTHLTVDARGFDDRDMPQDFREAALAVQTAPGSLVRPAGPDVMRGYRLLKDVYGKPALLVRTEGSREYRQQFLASLRYFVVASGIVAIALGAMSIFCMESLILGRLAKLSGFVRSVRTDENLSSRLSMAGRDELSELAGAVNQMLGALERDAAERAGARAALRENEAKYRELVENANSIILRMDVMGNITFFNEFAQNFFGYSDDEIIGRNIVGTIIPPVESTGRDLTEHVRDLCQRTHLYKVDEQESTRKDGSRVWISWTNRPILDASGKVAGILCVGADVTDRKLAEDKLRERQAKLESIFRAVPAGMGVVVNRVFTEVNDYFCAMTAYPRKELIGCSSRMIYASDEDFQHVGSDGYRQMDERGVGSVETRFKCRDGRVIEVLLSLSPIMPGNPSGGVTFTALDITERKRAAQTLAQERNLLRTLIDIIPDCVYVMDAECRKVLSNPADLKAMGMKSLDEVIGKTDFDVFPREVAEQFRADDMSVITTGQPLVNKEEVVPSADGSTRWILTTKVPLRGEDGEIVGLVGVGRDISARKTALEALEESERRYRSLFNGMLNGYSLQEIICDAGGRPCDYRFLDVNPAWEKITGLTRDQVVGKTFLDIYKTVVDGSWIEKLGTVALSGRGIHFEQYSAPLGKYLEVTAYCPKRGQFAVTFTDVTERRRAEEEIQSLRTQIDFILGATKTGIDIIDSEFNVRYVDPEWKKVYGDYAGRKCYEYFMGADKACPGCGIVTALKTRKVTVTEEVLMRENNRPIQVTTLPFQDKSGEWLVAEVNVDVSERKRLEAQLLQAHKMEAIGQLAGGIAHDFNNLLTGILGYANMLRLESVPGTTVHDGASTIEKAAERASELTKQLLGFARRGKFLRVPVDLHAIAHEVARLLSRTIDKNISITQRFTSQRAWVMGDPDQIEQAVLNLAVNARDAMPDGGELTVETDIVNLDESYCRGHADATPGNYVKVSVSDTGCGIPKELRERIFEPFFTTKQQGRGTGMGLAMVYGIVKNHGGFIRLYSEVGQGTRFDVYLPLSDENGIPAPAEKAALVKGTGRILFVDDEDVVREVASDMLRSLGYEVVTATSGSGAIEYYREHANEIDLAIIDLVMPGMGARECFHGLKQINPKLRAVLSSGYGLNGKAQETVDEGMRGFVQKPYTLAELSDVVRKAMTQ